MLAGPFLLEVDTAAAMVGAGAQQLMVPVGVVAGVQAGAVDIMALLMAIPMQLATMHHQWFMQLRPW